MNYGGRSKLPRAAGVAVAGLARVVLALALALAGAWLVVASLTAGSDADESTRGSDAPLSIYQRRDDCDLPCFASAASDRFTVAGGADEIQFVVFTNFDDASGPARVSVIDPSGDLRYERTFTNEAPQDAAPVAQDSATWHAEIGEWTLTRSYVGVSGSLTFDAWSIDAFG